MSGIFISYRREDSSYIAGRLHDRLSEHFGADQIFRDVDTILPGVDFVKRIEQAVASCDVLVAVIGNQWLGTGDPSGNRRLDNPKDFVRLEIAAALDRDVLVIPVLVENARMPSETDLPESLVRLSTRNALELTDSRWDYEVQRLIDGIEQLVTPAEAPATATAVDEPGAAGQSATRPAVGPTVSGGRGGASQGTPRAAQESATPVAPPSGAGSVLRQSWARVLIPVAVLAVAVTAVVLVTQDDDPPRSEPTTTTVAPTATVVPPTVTPSTAPLPARATPAITARNESYEVEVIGQFQASSAEDLSGSIRRLDLKKVSGDGPDGYGATSVSRWRGTFGRRCLTSGGSSGNLSVAGEPPHHYAYGIVGLDATKVELVWDDGRRVEAALGDQTFSVPVRWWIAAYDTADPDQIVAADASGSSWTVSNMIGVYGSVGC